MNINTIYEGNSLEILKILSSESIDCVVTSPPYFGLRNYETDQQIWDGKKDCLHEWVSHIESPRGGKAGKNCIVGANKDNKANNREYSTISHFCKNCNAWKGDLGLEPEPEMYVDHLVQIFSEVKRVIKKEGTCWVNIGDTYWGGGNNRGSSEENLSEKQFSNRGARGQNQRKWSKEFPAKSLCNIPSRFSIEMQNRGWILRNEIIWKKPNCMPSSVNDRFTVDFEKLFFFVKSRKYHFEQQFEEANANENLYRQKLRSHKNYNIKYEGYKNNFPIPRADGKRNKRSVWTIPTHPFSEAHFATFPEQLIETPIKAGCPERGIVLDPFMGAGTSALVALKLNRHFVGIELNPEYIKIAEKRIKPSLEQRKLIEVKQ